MSFFNFGSKRHSTVRMHFWLRTIVYAIKAIIEITKLRKTFCYKTMRLTHFLLLSSVLRHCVLPLNHLIIEMHIMMLERIPLKLCEPFIQRGTGFLCLFSAHLLLREGESAPLYTSAKSRYLDCHFTPFNHFCHNIHALSEKGRHFKAYLDGLKVNEKSNQIGQLRV